jgi:NTP pyrophosphatase (non-canonical NTP hydrolase)
MSATLGSLGRDPGAARGGPTQRRVREALMRVGGYWRPLAALARALEELGEVAELLLVPDPPGEGLAEELADLWIITTALADQFLGDVADPGSRVLGAVGEQTVLNQAERDPLAELVAAAGRMARIVNYYDGPKTPRSLAGWCSLGDAVAALHERLETLAGAHRLDLAAAVERKLDAIPARDGRRFASSAEDPSTAPCLQAFRWLKEPVLGLDPRDARVWGRTVSSPEPAAAELDEIAPVLASFAKAAIHERLEAFVLCVVACEPGATLAQRPNGPLEALLSAIAARDPAGASGLPGSLPARPESFSFAGVALAVAQIEAPSGGSELTETFVVFADRRSLLV